VPGDLEVVERELAAYGHGLIDRPRLVVLNKVELIDEQDLAPLLGEINKRTQKTSKPASAHSPLVISAVTHRGLDGLLAAVWKELGIATEPE
jgi:GTPase